MGKNKKTRGRGRRRLKQTHKRTRKRERQKKDRPRGRRRRGGDGDTKHVNQKARKKYKTEETMMKGREMASSRQANEKDEDKRSR